jgi:amidase
MSDPGALDATAATELAQLVRDGECTPSEIVGDALDRIAARDPVINAVVHRRDERARAEASELNISADAPFRGVPIVVKDIDTAAMVDEPLTLGMRVLRDAQWRAREDSPLMRRLRAAGFVVVGRTNVPELCASGTTEPDAFGPSHNPWDLTRTPGGSSGGSAAAVAAGMVAVAHGSDGGGSVRMPASCCGLVGLKPTRGRISDAPAGASWGGLSTDGALARTVRDAAALLDVMAGNEPGDWFSAPALPGPLAAETERVPPPCRIGVRVEGVGDADPTDPEVAAVVTALGETLSALGHHVELASPPALDDADAQAEQGLFVAAEVANEVAQLGRMLGRAISPSELEVWNARLVEAAAATPAARVVQAREWLLTWSRRLIAWWAVDGYDLLVTPVITQPPFELGWMKGDRTPEEMAGIRRRLGWLLGAWNVTGQPVVAVPAGRTTGGLPIGAQLVGAPGREDLLVRIAAQVEAARPWPLVAPAA